MHPAAALPGLDRGRPFFSRLVPSFPKLLLAPAIAGLTLGLFPAGVMAGGLADPTAGACASPASVSAIVYTVTSGDSLYGIAASFGVSGSAQDDWIAKVVSVNSLSDPDSLTTGQSLALPPPPAPDPAKGATPYTVKSGDTLSSIADKLGIGDADQACWLAKVVSLNSLASADMLTAGGSLMLPPAPVASASATSAPGGSKADAAAASAAAPLPKKGGLVYTVAPGDTLYGIAIKLGVPATDQDGWVASTVNLSQLTDADDLTAGQVLTVPPLASASTGTAVASAPVAAVAAPVTATPAATATPAVAAVSTTPVPAAAATPSATAAPNPALASITPSPIYLQGGSFYTLKAGDSLKAIAQKLGVPADKQDFWIAEVAAINGISPTALPIGDGIKIP